jgi:hypothetical protein
METVDHARFLWRDWGGSRHLWDGKWWGGGVLKMELFFNLLSDAGNLLQNTHSPFSFVVSQSPTNS